MGALGGGAGAGAAQAGEPLLPHGTIQVTPQDKEAIERVSNEGFFCCCFFYIICPFRAYLGTQGL